MATSEIDQLLLGAVAHHTTVWRPGLQSALYQVLGLSVLLSTKVKQLHDSTRQARLVDEALPRQIIWLAYEGLDITEHRILPYSQVSKRPPRLIVMAYKLRASFYHVLCRFTDPIDLAWSVRGASSTDRTDRTLARNGRRSVASASSYVTNPYALGPASPPPSYPLPPLPFSTWPDLFPPPGVGGMPGRSVDTSASPDSHAEDLRASTRAGFSKAYTLAAQYLPGSDPLRLSIAYEYCFFLWQSIGDATLAKERAHNALGAVNDDPADVDKGDFRVVQVLVQAIAGLSEARATPPIPESLATRPVASGAPGHFAPRSAYMGDMSNGSVAGTLLPLREGQPPIGLIGLREIRTPPSARSKTRVRDKDKDKDKAAKVGKGRS